MFFKTNPPSLANNAIEKKIEKLIHSLIYITIICIIVCGFSKSSIKVTLLLLNDSNFSYSGFKVLGVTIFNQDFIKSIGTFLIFISSKLAIEPKIFASYFSSTHKVLAIFILPFLIALHIIAILYHQFVAKKNVFKRMFG